MNAILKRVNSFISNHKRLFTEILLLVAFSVITFSSVKQCTYWKDSNSRNIAALTDSINYWKTKNGNTVAEKTLIKGSLADLKLVNDSLYNMVKDMKVNNPSTVIGGTTVITNREVDTMWVNLPLKVDTPIYKEFNFSDKYRTLSGNIYYITDTLGLRVNKDQVQFDYALAIQDGKVYMTSDNPYVKFTSITGLEVPSKEQKKKRFGIGPVVYGGYDFNTKSFGYGLGVGITYSVFQW